MPRPRAQVDLALLVPIFARDGRRGASVDDLAQACGVAKPTLYARVGDKDALFRATAAAAVERLVERLYDAADRTRYAAVEERVAAFAAELADCDRAGARLVLAVDPSPDALARLRAAIAEPLRRDSRLADGPADAVATALLGALALAVAAEEPFDAAPLTALVAAGVAGEPEPADDHWGA